MPNIDVMDPEGGLALKLQITPFNEAGRDLAGELEDALDELLTDEWTVQERQIVPRSDA